jgi:hypothetical protein
MITIRRCKKQDITALMKFIDTYWRKDHVLATSRALMDWQHKAQDGYNYLMAWDEDVLVGVLGYIPTRRYDKELYAENILWLSLWKVRDDCKAPMLGLKILKALEAVEPNVGLAVSGINLTHPPMYKALGYHVADMVQYYITNANASQNLLQFPKDYPLAVAAIGSATLVEMYATDLASLTLPDCKAVPQKTPRYFIKRFIEHPFYDYQVFGIAQGNAIHALIATRIVHYADSCALRIVDFCGDANVLGACGSAFANLMFASNAEYMDFWQYGIAPEILARAGFEAIDRSGDVICPNFFEPFKAKNERVMCCVQTSFVAPIVVCRADGDQDRPNMITV